MIKRDWALILIDIQEGFHDPVWGPRNNPRFEEAVSDLLSWWRSAGGRVIHVQHLSRKAASPLAPGKTGAAFMSCSAPIEGEITFAKNVNSAFIGTGLEGYLKERAVSNLVFAGLVTDHCVSTSVRMAGNLGFSPVVLSDVTATFDRVSHDGQKFTADLVHSVSLASLNEEFARVMELEQLQQRMADEVAP